MTQIIRRNPCRIDGAGKEESPERDVVSLPAVFAIADALPVRYRALALLATFASMRWGELVGLRRENIDLDACEIRIVETTAELDRGGMLPETPQVQGRPADSVIPRRAGAGTALASRTVLAAGGEGPDLRWPEGGSAAEVKLPADLEQCLR